MGNRPSIETIQLPQDPYYIRHCQQQPQPFNQTLHIDLATLKGAWVDPTKRKSIAPRGALMAAAPMTAGGGEEAANVTAAPVTAAPGEGAANAAALANVRTEVDDLIVESHAAMHEVSNPDLYAQVVSTTFHCKPQLRVLRAPAPAPAAAGPDNGVALRRTSDVEMVETVDMEAAGGDHRLVEDSLMLAAAACCGKVVTHILDGYSWGLVTRISTDQHRHTYISVALAPVPDDMELQEEEERRNRELKFGMFTKGRIPWYQWLFCCGRTGELASTGQVIERRTAHQPIFYPPLNQAYFCSSGSWPCFEVGWNAKEPDQCSAEFKRDAWVPQAWLRDKLGKWRYVCMHPQYDYASNKLLTYTFKHASTSRKTNMKFYEFDGSGVGVEGKKLPKALPTAKGYKMYDRVALHMFGFTKRYFVVFANSLQLKQPHAGHCSGTCSLTCGTPIMRALNPEFCGDLIIHFIPRPGFTNNDRFIINTKCQGNVYHTINCFDEELENGEWTGRVVVDAFVSKLNAERESAQFELDPEQLVYDNEGEPFRFLVDSPAVPNKRSPCRFQAIASDVDSTIDFHCINPRYNGKRHRFSYMVSHTRHRDDKGCVLWVESRIIKIDVNYAGVDPLAYDPDHTRQQVRHSPSWQDPDVAKPLTCYLRTPLFVARLGAKEEDDGHLFCWSFDTEPTSTDKDGLRAYVLQFDARTMELLMRVPMPDGVVIPYTVHSNIYSRSIEQAHAEEQWNSSATPLAK